MNLLFNLIQWFTDLVTLTDLHSSNNSNKQKKGRNKKRAETKLNVFVTQDKTAALKIKFESWMKSNHHED